MTIKHTQTRAPVRVANHFRVAKYRETLWIVYTLTDLIAKIKASMLASGKHRHIVVVTHFDHVSVDSDGVTFHRYESISTGHSYMNNEIIIPSCELTAGALERLEHMQEHSALCSQVDRQQS